MYVFIYVFLYVVGHVPFQADSHVSTSWWQIRPSVRGSSKNINPLAHEGALWERIKTLRSAPFISIDSPIVSLYIERQSSSPLKSSPPVRVKRGPDKASDVHRPAKDHSCEAILCQSSLGNGETFNVASFSHEIIAFSLPTKLNIPSSRNLFGSLLVRFVIRSASAKSVSVIFGV